MQAFPTHRRDRQWLMGFAEAPRPHLSHAFRKAAIGADRVIGVHARRDRSPPGFPAVSNPWRD
jgi:hypothetical protein